MYNYLDMYTQIVMHCRCVWTKVRVLTNWSTSYLCVSNGVLTTLRLLINDMHVRMIACPLYPHACSFSSYNISWAYSFKAFVR